ncbi:MAG: TIGR00730 family Rossman fold protein [Bacteroidota bacterium]
MLTKTVCVYCASSTQCKTEYYKEAEKFGRMLALNNCSIIYGGGNVGLMGYLADGALSEGGIVTGVIPVFLKDLELGHKGISELRVVSDMHVRKSVMLKESDCIVALPGGCGTYEELFEAIAWKRLGIINKPIIIVNILNYFDPLIALLEHTRAENFIDEKYDGNWLIAASVEEAMDLIIGNEIMYPKHKDFTE